MTGNCHPRPDVHPTSHRQLHHEDVAYSCMRSRFRLSEHASPSGIRLSRQKPDNALRNFNGETDAKHNRQQQSCQQAFRSAEPDRTTYRMCHSVIHFDLPRQFPLQQKPYADAWHPRWYLLPFLRDVQPDPVNAWQPKCVSGLEPFRPCHQA